MKFEYKVQEKPVGLADAFILGADFIGDDNIKEIKSLGFSENADIPEYNFSVKNWHRR